MRDLVILVILLALLGAAGWIVVLGINHVDSHPRAAMLAVFGGGLMALFTAEALVDYIAAICEDHRRNRRP
jgi:hypothetical protein